MAPPELLSILLIALSLSADCFAVALAGSCSLPKFKLASILRTACAFGLAQFSMPVIGWWIGRSLLGVIANLDHWVAFALLSGVGAWMIREALHAKDAGYQGADISRGWVLFSLAIATSIDSLAAGLSLGILKVSVWAACSIIGAVAFFVTILGFMVANKVGSLFGQRAKLIGGAVLISLGLWILLRHLLGG